MNVFSGVRQFGGGSYPTAINAPQQVVLIWCNAIDENEVKKWLRAYGVTRFVVPGPKSPEFWKPVRDPARFEKVFPLLWREDDTSIYEVPGAGPVPVNFHRGWRATVNGVPRRVLRNDYGTITLDPPCTPPCEAVFTFDGGWEAKLTRAAAVLALLWLLLVQSRPKFTSMVANRATGRPFLRSG
jgi:hypothetical protein